MPLTVQDFSAAAANATHQRDHVGLQNAPGHTDIVTHDRNPLSRLIQWMSPDKAANRTTIQALHAAMRNEFGAAIADAVHTQFLQGKEATGGPLSARRVELALHEARSQHLQSQLTAALGDAHAVRTTEIKQLATQLKALDPAAYQAFFAARLGNVATPAREFTLAYLAVPDNPTTFGVATPPPAAQIDTAVMAASDPVTLTAATTPPHAEQQVIERFHGLPHLEHKYGTFAVTNPGALPMGVNLGALVGGLNAVESARMDARLNAVTPGLANQAHGVALDLGLSPTEANKFLQRLCDKLDYGDVSEGRLRTESLAGGVATLRLVAAESATSAQTDTFVHGLNGDQQLKLLAACVDTTSPYPGFREGSDRMMAAIERDPNASPALKSAVTQLRTGYWSAADFVREVDNAVTHQNSLPQPAPALDLTAVTTACNLAADARITSIETALNNQQAAVNGLLTTLLAEVTNGNMTPGQFKQATGLSETQGRALLAATQVPLTHAEVETFGKLFGSAINVPTPTLPGAAPNAVVLPQQKRALEGLAQIFSQVHALTHATGRYQNGLDNMVLALPTMGKPLSELTYTQTLAKELDATLTTSGVAPGAARNAYPILVFDQSGMPLLGQNQAILANISAQHNVRIESISMADVNALGAKLGVTGMFDTTGTGKAGYAGARNIANMAALVVNAAIKQDPTRTIADVLAMPAPVLKALLQAEMGNGKTVLMGDDDASLKPGFLHAKALITNEHPGEYITSKTVMDGRGTTAAVLPNSAAQIRTGMAWLKSIAMSATAWVNGNINPVMAAALSSPGACLNLPVPTEESHFAAYEGVGDILGRATHHSGDRYDDVGPRLKGFISYTHQGALADVLLDCGVNYGSSPILPWNNPNLPGSPAQDPNRSLFSIMQYASTPAVKEGMQIGFFGKLANFETIPKLNGLLTTDYRTEFGNMVPGDPTEARQISEVRDAFLGAQSDLATAVRFRDQLNLRLKDAFENLPPPQQVGNWGAIHARIAANDPTATADAITFLVQHGHDAAIIGAADLARQDLNQANNPLTGAAQTPVDVTATPLAQIVFLSSKAIGGGEFNQLAHNAVT
jgi:hypothetical protein